MDFNPTAMPVRLAIREIQIHACIHHSVRGHLVHA